MSYYKPLYPKHYAPNLPCETRPAHASKTLVTVHSNSNPYFLRPISTNTSRSRTDCAIEYGSNLDSGGGRRSAPCTNTGLFNTALCRSSPSQINNNNSFQEKGMNFRWFNSLFTQLSLPLLRSVVQIPVSFNAVSLRPIFMWHPELKQRLEAK